MTYPRWTWRDSGILSAGANCGLDKSALEAAGEAGQLRFHRFAPSVLIGAHEDAEKVARVEYCRQHNIVVARRLTGGGALYVDERQLFWSLTMPSPSGRAAGESLTAVLERLCRAVAEALCALGVAAAFQAFNDVEIDGHKIACGFLRDNGCRMLFQGSLLLDIDVDTMLKVLRVPTEKLSTQGLQTARKRFATLSQKLGRTPSLDEIECAVAKSLGTALGVEFNFSSDGLPHPAEFSTDADVVPRPGSESVLHAFHRTSGGVLHAEVGVGDGTVVRGIHLSGSVQVSPPDLFGRIEHQLTGGEVGQLDVLLDQFLGNGDWEVVGATMPDLRYVLQLAVNHRQEQSDLGVDAADANMLMVHSPERNQMLGDILACATVMLVPYCAKPLWCKWRFRDGCTECGRCHVGEAYRLARERRMRVISINNYEHLRETLGRIRAEGATAYVGMCCGNFYLKRRLAFDEAGLPAVLVDISGANCYELRQEDFAYAGAFQAESQLNIDLVRKVAALIPVANGRKP